MEKEKAQLLKLGRKLWAQLDDADGYESELIKRACVGILEACVAIEQLDKTRENRSRGEAK